jgi:endo-1,4-beta-D-glucanase Y
MGKNIVILIIILLVTSCARENEYTLKVFNYIDRSADSVEEKILVEFIKDKMMDEKGGIYTNLSDSSNISELPSGQEILSESIGLYMLYLSTSSSKDDFDHYFRYLNNQFLRNGVVSWRIKDSELYSSTGAVIDDLRIVKSLFIANDKWNDEMYINLIEKISDILLKKAINQGMLVNDYGENGSSSSIINLSYLDLYSLKRLEKINSKWKEVFKNAVDIIEKGRINKTGKFYYMYYDVVSKKYYGDGRNISVLDSFLVDLHLSEIGILDKDKLDWFNKVKDTDIYSTYDIHVEKYSSDIESTSIYSVLVRILKLNAVNDISVLEEKIKSFQIVEGQYSGGFGNENEMEFYSFDNLNALLYFVAKGGGKNEK